MLENFIYSQKKSLFLEQLNTGNILDEAIVFIEDTGEIWNHGTYFAGCDYDPVAFAQIQTMVAQLQADVTELENTVLENEETTAAALNDLNDKVSGCLTEAVADEKYATTTSVNDLDTELNDLQTNVSTNYVQKTELSSLGVPYFQTFATLDAYNTAVSEGTVTYPCIAYIESTGEVVYYIAAGEYNAIVSLSPGYIANLGPAYDETGSYIMARADYFEEFTLDGENYLNNTAVYGDMDWIVFPSTAVAGDSFKVSFKLKTDTEFLYSGTEWTNNGILFYACLDYIEMDSTFWNRIENTADGMTYPVLMIPTMSQNFTLKFIGDFEKGLGLLQWMMYLLYGPHIATTLDGASATSTVTFKIPAGNTTYGSSSDTLVEGDVTTYSLYALVNYTITENQFNSLIINYEEY